MSSNTLIVRKVEKFPKEKPTSLVEEIYEILMAEIITGKLHPGEYLSELTLLERFHASRTPIREALIHLYKEGLLQKGRFKGYVIAEMSMETVRELYQLRLLLEPAAAKLAARNPQARHHCENLIQIHTRMQEHASEGIKVQDTLEELSELDANFHTSIGEASGNKKLAKFIAEIMNQVRRVYCGCYQNKEWDIETLQEHKVILDAVKVHDHRKAERHMVQHLKMAFGRAKEISMGTFRDGDFF
jgi:DNA-binding GntR family transcriptional regulator